MPYQRWNAKKHKDEFRIVTSTRNRIKLRGVGVLQVEMGKISQGNFITTSAL